MRERNSELLSAIKTAGEAALRLHAGNDALRAEIKQLRADAERYRWLRVNDFSLGYCDYVDGRLNGDTLGSLDHRIDAAREDT